MDVAVVRRKIARALQSLCCGVVVSLSQCEQSPVGPTCGFWRRELCELGELRVGLHVVANLERRETDVERSHQLVVFGRRFCRQVGAGPASR